MLVEIGTFLEKFNNLEVESAELKMKSSPYYYIVQKSKGKADLYLDREVEYQEDPVDFEKEGSMLIPNKVGVFTLRRHHAKKEAELVKHMENIEDIKKYVDFEDISEVIYER